MEMEEDLICENLDESPFLQRNLAMCDSQDNTVQLWMSLTIIFKGGKPKFLIVFWTDRNARCVFEDTCEVRQCQYRCSGSGHWSHAAKEVCSHRRVEVESRSFNSEAH